VIARGSWWAPWSNHEATNPRPVPRNNISRVFLEGRFEFCITPPAWTTCQQARGARQQRQARAPAPAPTAHLVRLLHRNAVYCEPREDGPVRECRLVAFEHRREHLVWCHGWLENNNIRFRNPKLAHRRRRWSVRPAWSTRSRPVPHGMVSLAAAGLCSPSYSSRRWLRVFPLRTPDGGACLRWFQPRMASLSGCRWQRYPTHFSSLAPFLPARFYFLPIFYV